MCKSDKEYLSAQICKFYASSVHNSETFDILHAFLSVNIAEL